MSSTALPGLNQHCAVLNLPRQHILLLCHLLAAPWSAAHPVQPTGRPRIPLLVLLVGLLYLLRKGFTLASAAALAGVGAGTLAGHYKELLAMISALGVVQADGTWLTVEKLNGWLSEMVDTGEIALVDGTWTRCPKPSKWLAQKPFYDSKHKIHAYNTQVLATGFGDVLAVHGGWPGAVSEPEQLRYSVFADAVKTSGVTVVADRGFRAARADMGVLCARGNHRTPQPGDSEITAARPECERAVSLLKNWKIMERTRLGWAVHHLAAAAVGVLVGLQVYGHRTAEWEAVAV